MKDTCDKDFNLTFWKIFGVNHRVYQPSDALNIERDKQADEQIYHSYLSNDDKLGNEKFALLQSKEIDNFRIFFTRHLIGDNQHSNFYVRQISNIVYNFNLFKTINFQESSIDLFSFQIALIIEYMNHHSFDITLFETSLKLERVMPFIDFSKKINKIGTNILLADKLSDIHEVMRLEIEKNYKTNLKKDISPSTFIKKISRWKKVVELPSLIDLLVITKFLSKKEQNRDKRIAFLFQFLLIRGLLHIEKTFNIDKNIKTSFLEKIQYFREQLRSEFKAGKDFIHLQEKYLFHFLETFEKEIFVNEVYKKLKIWIENTFSNNELIQIDIPNREKIISLFDEKKYQEALKLINFKKDNNELEQILINKANYFIKFIISIKLQNKSFMEKSFKEFDRYALGSLLSFTDKKYSSQEFIEALKNSNSIVDCAEKLDQYLQINYQV